MNILADPYDAYLSTNVALVSKCVYQLSVRWWNEWIVARRVNQSSSFFGTDLYHEQQEHPPLSGPLLEWEIDKTFLDSMTINDNQLSNCDQLGHIAYMHSLHWPP